MGSCSANVYKVSSSTKVTLTLKPVAKKVTFDISDDDVTTSKKANELPISEKAFVPFTVLLLAYYMLQKPTGYSITS